jgi:hypothetical protein
MEMLTRLLLIAILVAIGGSVQSQSLAEVAAKEKDRRAKTGGASKSFTDADLRDAASKRAREGSPSSNGSPPAAPPARSGSASGPPVAQEASGTTDSGLSDDAKKSRGAEYKVRLAEAESYLKQAEGYVRIAQENWDFVNSHTNSSTISLDYARSLLAAAKKEAERRRKLRDDIEDAARREGIPPGYLR